MDQDREMKDYRKDAMAFWAQSRADLATALTLLDAGIYYASVFFSQQAAEKALKAAFMISTGALREFAIWIRLWPRG